jgi:thiamine biosynthesis lipoprotein
MGVQTRIVLYSPSETQASEAAAAAFAEINRLDGVMSDYLRSSELNRLSDAAGGDPIPVSPALLDVLSISLRIAAASDGAFDPTIGPAVKVWRDARSSGALPDETVIAAARDLVNWRNLKLDPIAGTAQLTSAGMRLDLGGIGKGYAAQAAVDLLIARGYPNCLVALAGDIAVGDAPPGEPGWKVAVAGEQAGPDSPRTLVLANAAVSTSGDTAQFVEIAGQRYSHICDPRTGLGIQARRSVTVVAPRGAEADALSTAACILGFEKASPVLKGFPGVAAAFEEHAKDGVTRQEFDPAHLFRWAAKHSP